MANFTVAGVAVRADGWSADVTLTGLAGQQGAIAYDFGTPGSTSTSNAYMRVTSEGYNAAGTLGTVERYVYFTKAVRLPYPNNSSLDETDSGSDLVVRVALSDWVYNDDKDGGAGTSGTDILVVCQSGTFTNGADVNEAYNSSATNNSTQDYPKAFGQWAIVPFQAFTSDPTLKFTARHRHKIAAVKFTLTDASTNSVNGFATSEVSNLRSVSGLYACEYEKELSLTTLTQGEVLTANAILYPIVGDADSVFDTSTVTADTDGIALGRCNYSFYNNKTGAATVTRYVNLDSGNDTTGDGSSGTPWATIEKALTDGNADDIVVTCDGASASETWGTVTAPSSINRWRVVRPATGKTITVTANGSEAYNTPHLKFSGITLNKSAQNAWWDGGDSTRYIWFDTCTFADAATGAPTVGPAYRSACCFMTGCTMPDGVEWGIGKNFAARMVYWLDGNAIDNPTGNGISYLTRLVANDVSEGFYVKGASVTGPTEDGYIIEYNKWHSCSYGNALFTLWGGSVNCTVGASFSGNIIERKSGTNPLIQLSADSSTSTVNHILLWHNTFAGERCNLFYNSTGSIAYAKTLCSVVGNSMEEYNIKADLFPTADGARVGNWACLHGVGYVANGSESTLGFCNAFPGLYSSSIMGVTEAESSTTPCSPNYTSDKSATGTGAGDGDYLPASPSDLIEALPAGWAMLPYDLYGKPIGNAGEGEIGGLQLAPAPTVSDVSPTSIAKGATADITVTGTGFVDGISAASNYATEFTVNTTTWNSTTEVVVNVTGGTGTAGAYLDALTLTNPDAQTVDVALTLTAASSGGDGGAGFYIGAPGKQKYRRIWWEE